MKSVWLRLKTAITLCHNTSNGGTGNNHVEKTLPQPQQQQPNKPQTTTQQQKQTHNKPPKNPRAQKNPQQQPNKKHTNKDQQTQKAAPFSTNSTNISSIRQNKLNNYFYFKQIYHCYLNKMLHKLH